ncbi:MAG TPA: hypothetical protein VH414_08840 [Lichenihabitans sp.]|jgi:hypothetical protein|nr:hypothetical protein [Lichenihabitans sp.]
MRELRAPTPLLEVDEAPEPVPDANAQWLTEADWLNIQVSHFSVDVTKLLRSA